MYKLSKRIALPPIYEGYPHPTCVFELTALSNGDCFDADPSWGNIIINPTTGETQKYNFGCNPVETLDQLIVSTRGNTIEIFDLKIGKTIDEFKLTEEKGFDYCWNLIRLSPTVFATCSSDGSVRVFDILTHEVTHIFQGHIQETKELLLLPDGRIASASRDDTIRIWNLKTNKCDRIFTGFRSKEMNTVTKLAVLPIEDKKYYIISSNWGQVRIWNPHNGECLWSFNEPGISFVVPWTDNRFITNCRGSELKVWNAKDKSYFTVNIHKTQVHKAQFLEENILVTASSDPTLKIYDLKENKLLQTLEGHQKDTRGFTILTDKRIVSSGGEGGVIVWSI